jgi:hypothetical protein
MIVRNWTARSRIAIFAIAGVVLLLVPGGAGAGNDPLEWHAPAAAAPFRKLLSNSEYERRSTTILKGLPQATVDAATRLPDHGLKLSGVFGAGALEAQGVTLADVIATADGEELWGRYSPPQETAVRVRYYSPRQSRFREVRAVTDLGLAFSVYRRPELALLRSKDRDSRWERDAFVGIAAAATDPDLAESAWNRALASGAPRSRLCLASGAQLALAQGRPQAALDFWYEAEHKNGPEPLDPLLAYRVMIANFKLEQARDLARKHPKLLPDVAEGLETLVTLHRARSQKERTVEAPNVRARGMYHRDARKDLVGLSPGAEDTFLQLLTKRDVYHTNPSSDHYTIVNLQLFRGLPDFELRLVLTMAPSDAQRAGFVKLARLDLRGVRTADNADHTETAHIGHVELEVPSGFSIRNCDPGDDVYFPDPMVVTDGKAKNSIRFVRVGDQLELFINERRVLYQPILADVVLHAIEFQIVGASTNVTEFALDELIPKL